MLPLLLHGQDSINIIYTHAICIEASQRNQLPLIFLRVSWWGTLVPIPRNLSKAASSRKSSPPIDID